MRLKIAFYVHTLTKGGAERAVSNIANYLSTQDFDVTVITSVKNESEYELSDTVNRIVLSDTNPQNTIKRYVKLIISLRRTIKAGNFDVIIPFMSGATIRTIFANIGFKSKIITSVRNNPEYEYAGFFGKICANYLLPKVDYCIFQTEDARAYFPQKLQLKSEIIPNAINDIFFNRVRKPIPYHITNCGRLAKQKNQAFLIDGFKQIQIEYPDAILDIYGIGEEYDAISSKIINEGLDGKVILHGETKDIGTVYDMTDVFVLSSDFEGMPNTLMEAMASGVPCISTDCPCGGPRFLIKNKINGILVPVRDIVSLIKAIKLLFENKKLKEDLGKAAKEDAKQFQLTNICQLWIDAIQKNVDKRIEK